MAGKSDKYFGSHELQSREERIKQSSDRGFGIVFAVVFGLIGAFSWWYKGAYWHYWLGIAAAFALVALVMPSVLAPLNTLWTKFGLLLFMVISPIVMGLVFYLCVVPIGLLMQLLGKDLLSLRWRKEAESYWIVRTPPGPKPDSLGNQF